MAMLHIIRSSGFTDNALAQCLSMVLADDSILLMDDGCYNVKHPLLLNALATKKATAIYFIDLHASARALTENQLPTQNIISSDNNNDNCTEADFLAITLSDALIHIFKHDNSITWS